MSQQCIKITRGKGYGCVKSTPGIRRAWIANFEDTLSPTISGTSSMVTALNMVGGTASGNLYYEYNFEKNTGDLKVKGERLRGGVGFDGELKLTFSKNTQDNFIQLETLMYNSTAIIVEDANSQYWLCGSETGCDANLLDVSWGATKKDFNGQEITFSFSESSLPIEINNLATITAVS